MKIFPSDKLSDAEFVNKVRKKTQSAQKRAWILLGFSVFYLGLIFLIWFITKKWNFSESGSGFVSGCFIGFFSGVFLIKAIMYFAFFLEHLFGNRKERLLIAYYEKLHVLNK